MTSLQEKIDGVLVEFNAYAREIGHQELTAKQIKNRTDRKEEGKGCLQGCQSEDYNWLPC